MSALRTLPLLLPLLLAARALGAQSADSAAAPVAAPADSIRPALAGFLVAADGGSYFGEIGHVTVAECTVAVFTAAGGYIEEVRVELGGVGDLSVGHLDLSSMDEHSGSAWIEIAGAPGRPPARPLLRLVWLNSGRIADQVPQATVAVPVVRFATWGTVAEIRPRADALHRVLRRAALRCGARPS